MSNLLFGQMNRFAHIALIDFEYSAVPGDPPDPLCLVVEDFRSGEPKRFWRDELRTMRKPPFPTGPNAVAISYYAPAELSCMLARDWPLPECVIDLFAEHRVATNGERLPLGNGLLGALAYRGLPHIESSVKDVLREKIISQTEWPPEDRAEILEYCASDVTALRSLLTAMLPTLDVPRALLRGRYTKAIAHMERNGIPVDTDLQDSFSQEWSSARGELVRAIDEDYGVYDGLHFKRGRFGEWLRINRIPWPRTEIGTLKLDDDTFKEQSAIWPALKPLRQLRQALTSMYVPGLPVGRDGRNRTLLAPFASKTGRNQPSAKKFAFGLPAWQRGIVRPPEGWALGYIDWSSQEIAVAAGLSGDLRLIQAYEGGDPYLGFGKDSGVAPPSATRESHPRIREICKTVMLGLLYGLGVDRMAYQAGISPALAAELILRHRMTYSRYWQWSEGVVTQALLTNEMSSVFGWHRKIGPFDRPTSLMNFPMQANSAEMMRVAAIAATEAGIIVCAPVHDAFLIAAPIDEIEAAVRHMRELMSQAGYVVTGGIHVRTEAKIIRYPDRYMDERGIDMWNRVVRLIERLDAVYPLTPVG